MRKQLKVTMLVNIEYDRKSTLEYAKKKIFEEGVAEIISCSRVGTYILKPRGVIKIGELGDEK